MTISLSTRKVTIHRNLKILNGAFAMIVGFFLFCLVYMEMGIVLLALSD